MQRYETTDVAFIRATNSDPIEQVLTDWINKSNTSGLSAIFVSLHFIFKSCHHTGFLSSPMLDPLDL